MRNDAFRFAHRLAVMAGEWNVDGMLRSMGWRQFQRWMWYEQMEPFGQLRSDYLTAMIVQMAHNVAVKKEDQKSIETFLLKFQRDIKPVVETEEEYNTRMDHLAEKILIMAHLLAGSAPAD